MYCRGYQVSVQGVSVVYNGFSSDFCTEYKNDMQISIADDRTRHGAHIGSSDSSGTGWEQIPLQL